MGEVKFSTIDLAFIKDYLRVDYIDDDLELSVALNSAKAFIRAHMDKSDYEIDMIPYAVTMVLQEVASYYNSKSSLEDSSVKENPVSKRLWGKSKKIIVG